MCGVLLLLLLFCFCLYFIRVNDDISMIIFDMAVCIDFNDEVDASNTIHEDVMLWNTFHIAVPLSKECLQSNVSNAGH